MYLPVSAPFQPVLDAPAIAPLPALANGYVTFGSFNRISKIGRPVVAAWGALLRAVPTARLLVAGVPASGSADWTRCSDPLPISSITVARGSGGVN